eukprot:1115690_1
MVMAFLYSARIQKCTKMTSPTTNHLLRQNISCSWRGFGLCVHKQYFSATYTANIDQYCVRRAIQIQKYHQIDNASEFNQSNAQMRLRSANVLLIRGRFILWDHNVASDCKKSCNIR